VKAASTSYQYKKSARIITSCECSASQEVEAVVAIIWSDGAQTFSPSSECSQNTLRRKPTNGKTCVESSITNEQIEAYVTRNGLMF